MARLKGSAAFLRLLVDEGVTLLFGNPGTTELPIMAALPGCPELQYVLGLQESVVVGMADGYARASRRLAAANVHVAPGLGNAMGALYGARASGAPLILTAGQQEQGHGLQEPLLYGPLVQMAQPLVKWAIEVTRVEDLPRVVRRAAKVALTPPTGPVFISLPGDVLEDECDLDLGRRTRVEERVRPGDEALQRLAAMLFAAGKPVIVAGQELAHHDAFAQAAELAEMLGAPVYQETIPYVAQFPSEHPACMGALSRVQKQVRATLEGHDLLLCLGGDLLRMSIASPIEPLPPGMPVAHLSERDWELGKNYPADVAIRANVKETLRALLPLLRARRSAEYAARADRRLGELKGRNWSAQRERSRDEARRAAHTAPIDPKLLALRLCEALPPDAVLVEEAVTAAPALFNFFAMRDPKCFFGLASGGLGFGLPGAVGVSLALPERPVVAFVGDGAAMYGVQALWSAAQLRRPVTFVIANNRGYRILKERARSMQGANAYPGMDLRDPEIDFPALASGFGLAARRVADARDIAPLLEACIASRAPNLVEVPVADGFGS